MTHKFFSNTLALVLTALLVTPTYSQHVHTQAKLPKSKKSAQTIILEATQVSKEKLSKTADRFSLSKRDLLQGAAIGSVLFGTSFLTKDPKLQLTLRVLSVLPMIVGLMIPKKVLSKVSDVDIEDGILCSNHACKGICPQCRITKAYLTALPVGFLYYGLNWLFTKRPNIPAAPDEDTHEDNEPSDSPEDNSSPAPIYQQQKPQPRPDEQMHPQQHQDDSSASDEEDVSEESSDDNSDPVMIEIPHPQTRSATQEESVEDVAIGQSEDEDDVDSTPLKDTAKGKEEADNETTTKEEHQQNLQTQTPCESATTNPQENSGLVATLTSMFRIQSEPELTPTQQQALEQEMRYQEELEAAYGKQESSEMQEIPESEEQYVEPQYKQTHSDESAIESNDETKQGSGWNWFGIWG